MITLSKNNMNYKILIAVTAEEEKFRRCVEKCPDKSKLVIINNWNHEGVGKFCNELYHEGAEIQWYPHNKGCGPSMNIGLKKIVDENLDYIIILSPSALFTNSVTDLADIVEEREKTEKNYYYLTQGTYMTDLHAFAITRRFVDEVGYYDENFYPVYYEDTDLCYRMKLMGIQKTMVYPPRICMDLGGGIKHDKNLFNLYWQNVPHIHDYYVRKWGGEHTLETFTHPFNDPTIGINEWKLEEDKIIKIP